MEEDRETIAITGISAQEVPQEISRGGHAKLFKRKG